MLCKKEKEGRGRRKMSPEDEYPSSASFLMDRVFSLLLFNISIGILPVTISGNKVRHSSLSLSTLFSALSSLALIFLSYVFVPISIRLFLEVGGKGVSGVELIAISVLKVSHIIGFLVLLLSSHHVARALPSIWKNLVTLLHISVIEVRGLEWKKLKVLRTFSRNAFFWYLLPAFAYQFSSTSNNMVDLIRIFYMNNEALIRDGKDAGMVITGKIQRKYGKLVI